eukprot:151140-Pelagomonas_calceolata.AAC.3
MMMTSVLGKPSLKKSISITCKSAQQWKHTVSNGYYLSHHDEGAVTKIGCLSGIECPPSFNRHYRSHVWLAVQTDRMDYAYKILPMDLVH